jgi:hypothetical protein
MTAAEYETLNSSNIIEIRTKYKNKIRNTAGTIKEQHSLLTLID